MSWKKKEDQFEVILKKVWQDVPSIIDAPKAEDLNFNRGEEEEKLYKAVNEKGLWLVQNPALMKLQMDERISPIVRMKPKWCMSLDDADNEKNSFRTNSFAANEERRGGVEI